jgi:hypothetical protein
VAGKVAEFVPWAVAWRQPDRDGNGPGFDLEVYPCMVTFSCYGLEAEQINEIIGVMVGLRFPLFDPQTSERFGL